MPYCDERSFGAQVANAQRIKTEVWNGDDSSIITTPPITGRHTGKWVELTKKVAPMWGADDDGGEGSNFQHHFKNMKGRSLFPYSQTYCAATVWYGPNSPYGQLIMPNSVWVKEPAGALPVKSGTQVEFFSDVQYIPENHGFFRQTFEEYGHNATVVILKANPEDSDTSRQPWINAQFVTDRVHLVTFQRLPSAATIASLLPYCPHSLIVVSNEPLT